MEFNELTIYLSKRAARIQDASSGTFFGEVLEALGVVEEARRSFGPWIHTREASILDWLIAGLSKASMLYGTALDGRARDREYHQFAAAQRVRDIIEVLRDAKEATDADTKARTGEAFL
ncbi:MAG: hypothetical protein ACTII7_07650 [Galactobacter sp.]